MNKCLNIIIKSKMYDDKIVSTWTVINEYNVSIFLFKITLICLRLQFYCISDRLDDIPDVLGPLSAAKKLFFFYLVLGQVSSLCRTGFEIEYNRLFLLRLRFCNNLPFVKSFIDHKIFLEKMSTFITF